jgi:hypothetical protein
MRHGWSRWRLACRAGSARRPGWRAELSSSESHAHARPNWRPARVPSSSARFCRSPKRFFNKIDRGQLVFEDPVPGLEHRHFDVNGIRSALLQTSYAI